MFIQLLRFLCVGVANTCVGLGTIYLLKWAADMADVPANLCGYVVGLCLSFVLNRRWTFRHAGQPWGAALRFGGVFAVAYSANLLTMLALRDGWAVDSYVAHLLAVVPYTALFFLGSRYFVFRRTPAAGDRLQA